MIFIVFCIKDLVCIVHGHWPLVLLHLVRLDPLEPQPHATNIYHLKEFKKIYILFKIILYIFRKISLRWQFFPDL